MKNIVLFASGSGTNAENIMEHFSKSSVARVTAVYCNKPGAGVIARAAKYNVPCRLFNREDFYESGRILKELLDSKTDLVVLAGFLWLVPADIVEAFPRRIVNIHPALLPGLGGKGMYGMKVHESILAAGAAKSGITIHYVNDQFDEGEILFTAECSVMPGDTAETLAGRIHELEYRHYPVVIEKLLTPGAKQK